MKRPNANKPQRKSKRKIAPHRERNIVSKIERLNQELNVALESRKPHLRNQLRRLEAMVLDPVFSLMFDMCCEIERLKEEVANAPTTKKRRLETQIRRLEAKITPGKKQKAIDDIRPMVVKSQEHIRQRGAPTNNTLFVTRLRREGVLTKTRLGRKWPISDTTARTVLRSVFGITGQRGRKPRSSE